MVYGTYNYSITPISLWFMVYTYNYSITPISLWFMVPITIVVLQFHYGLWYL